jgi:hypothetical protein
MTKPATDQGARGLAKRALAPFERRLEIVVTHAVEAALRRESETLREALRADVATLVELTYEMQRLVARIDSERDPA